MKKQGRKKEKYGKRKTFYLSYECIAKLKEMTSVSRNESAFVETLINMHYIRTKKQETLNGAKERKGDQESKF